jgi:hypothetical protein
MQDPSEIESLIKGVEETLELKQFTNRYVNIEIIQAYSG